METKQDVVLTVEEVAQILRISRGQAYKAVRNGEIPVIKIGTRILVPVQALANLLASAQPLKAEKELHE